MLNLLPNIRIGGENDNAFDTIYDFLYGFSNEQHSKSNLFSFRLQPYGQIGGFDGPWGHHPINRNDLICVFQTILGSINPPPPPPRKRKQNKNGDGDAYTTNEATSIIEGFKEVRLLLTNESDASIVELYERINHVVPCSRIIINYNSNIGPQVDSQIALGWVPSTDREEATQKLMKHNERLLQLSKILGTQQSHVFDASIYKINSTKALEEINNLVKWLGFKDCIFDKLIHANKNHTYEAQQTTFHIGPNCRYGGGG